MRQGRCGQEGEVGREEWAGEEARGRGRKMRRGGDPEIAAVASVMRGREGPVSYRGLGPRHHGWVIQRLPSAALSGSRLRWAGLRAAGLRFQRAILLNSCVSCVIGSICARLAPNPHRRLPRPKSHSPPPHTPILSLLQHRKPWVHLDRRFYRVRWVVTEGLDGFFFAVAEGLDGFFFFAAEGLDGFFFFAAEGLGAFFFVVADDFHSLPRIRHRFRNHLRLSSVNRINDNGQSKHPSHHPRHPSRTPHHCPP